jgi:ADP-heptose:LPS heptosyltransferase
MTLPPLRKVGKVAVLRPNALGDFVFCLPALHALRAVYPAAEIVYLGLRWHADFLDGRIGPVDRVVVVPPMPGIGAAPDAGCDAAAASAFIDAMRRERFDLVLQMYGGGRYANPLVQRFDARLTVGMRAPDAAPLGRCLPYYGGVNRRLQLLELAALAGAQAWPLTNSFHVTSADRARAAAALPANDGKPLVLLQPGSTDTRRCWPAARFAAVADALTEQGARIVINGTADEAPLVREVAGAMRHAAVDLSGALSVAALCGVLERCALVVSNDTGPLHLALEIGVPCVGIYWFTNLLESAPLAQQMHRAAVSLQVHCPVCGEENLLHRCAHDVSFVDAVTLDEVRALAIGLYRDAR